MKKKIIIFSFISIVSATSLNLNALLDLKKYIDYIKDGRNQLIDAINGLKAGKTEIGKIYDDQLKPQLFDEIDKNSVFVAEQTDEIKGALGPLTDMPSWVKPIVVNVTVINDLEPTLQWTIDHPLKDINNHLQKVKSDFQVVAEKLKPPTAQDMTANEQKIKEIYAAADAMEKPEDQAAKRKEADAYIAQLDRQKKAGSLYAKFDIAIAKLQSAVCKIERTMKALKAEFTPSPECSAR